MELVDAIIGGLHHVVEKPKFSRCKGDDKKLFPMFPPKHVR